jgi:zinc transport system substrate-binding protein
MKRIYFFLIILLLVSCGRRNESESRIISVSIAPFRYFIEEISGGTFDVNVMVPAGASPHIYEPVPDQINKLRRSDAYVSNGFLGFEVTWLDRFYEINRDMKKISLADNINIIESEHHHEGEHSERADPHYWVSPLSAYKMASSVKELLIGLDPGNRKLFQENHDVLLRKISEVDSMARELSSPEGKRVFMIFHPTLGYLARDYGLEEISFEQEGKEPSPSMLMELIDRARKEDLKVILVQREYDVRNAQVVANATGAVIKVIDPLSEDWYSSTVEIIRVLKNSFEEEPK